ncbi:Phenylpropionate dioxygenase, large terminal subunit [Enhydrobacter aerosaccus]|uniref:Phenylpropionate dioxygenase, large terminal subunit n=1 Tax=Enhydrobacter aerosaccus TaxID=225324 RepID=A0A1T4TP24_9HYPH|nr:SRPBCC family protein [Enhydrobacter aerosaccus]SKA42167.1 Phenylpropionate dioxygenase, large terminal subunit [Enhydrobacter aerosaccus]
MTTSFSEDWARSLVDAQAFQDEQRRLAYVWTFLGFADDAAEDGDWFRASIATKSVFVQRFGEELRGFENVCAHRFYPLRHEAKGNGPLICGFHHWQYNRDGRVVGIPICKMVYGKPAREVGGHLKKIELSTCGTMVFGRFPGGTSLTLKDYLGEAFPILEAMTKVRRRPYYMEREIRANWRLNLHITLDDYHGPTIHPSTLGRNGYIPSMSMRRYFRFGANSAYLFSDDEDCFEKLLAGCRDGTYRSKHFFVFQILPNLIIAHVDADRPFWFSNIMQYSPLAPDHTTYRSWSYPSPFEADLSRFARAKRFVTDIFRRPIYQYYFNRVVREDVAVCERLQEVAHQVDRRPLLGAQEERIAWFEEAIRNFPN